MKYPTLSRPLITLFALFPVLTAFSTAQIVSGGDVPTCTVAVTVSLTVSDESGAVIQNAFTLFRVDRLGRGNTKPLQLELHTDATGKASASIPCGYGYVDLFVAADGFTPQAKKLLIGQQSSSMSVRLSFYPEKQY
jgi:hypothetical protein